MLMNETGRPHRACIRDVAVGAELTVSGGSGLQTTEGRF